MRRGLHELASKKIDFTTLKTEADKDDGIFGDHLRRILVLLAKDPDLTETLKGVTEGKPCPTPESFYRLRSAGIIHGADGKLAQMALIREDANGPFPSTDWSCTDTATPTDSTSIGAALVLAGAPLFSRGAGFAIGAGRAAARAAH